MFAQIKTELELQNDEWQAQVKNAAGTEPAGNSAKKKRATKETW
jgi:hypothetical protein